MSSRLYQNNIEQKAYLIYLKKRVIVKETISYEQFRINLANAGQAPVSIPDLRRKAKYFQSKLIYGDYE